METQSIITWPFIILMLVFYVVFVCVGMMVLNAIHDKQTEELENEFLDNKKGVDDQVNSNH